MRHEHPDLSKYLSVGQIARATGYSEAMIRHLADQGEFTVLTTSIGRLIHEDVIDQLIERRERNSRPAQ